MSVRAADSFILTESSLTELVKNAPPAVKELELGLLGVKKSKATFNESFGHTVTTGYEYSKSNEVAMISYQPVMTPVEKMNITYSKNFKSGFAISSSIYTQKNSTSNGMITDGITTGVSARLTVDLYKNFLGGLTKSNDAVLNLSQKKAQLQKEIGEKVFLTNVRKLYWTIVANNESLKISTKLLATAESQLKDAKKRLRNKITDIGEVSRYQSQLAGRKASLLYLKYQREQAFEQLKTLLPELAKKELSLGNYSMEAVVENVLNCTMKIASMKEAPLDYTLMDELLGLTKDIYSKEQDITKRYTRPDFKFFIEGKNQAIDTGKFSDAWSNFGDNRKEGVALGMSLSFDLGGAQKNVQDVQERIDAVKFTKEQEETLGKMNTYHMQIVKSIALLNQVVTQLETNTLYLSKSLREVKRKYDQARISYRDYINEQNLLLESNLNEINTKLEIINTLFDYFSVFTNTDCKINK